MLITRIICIIVLAVLFGGLCSVTGEEGREYDSYKLHYGNNFIYACNTVI